MKRIFFSIIILATSALLILLAYHIHTREEEQLTSDHELVTDYVLGDEDNEEDDTTLTIGNEGLNVNEAETEEDVGAEDVLVESCDEIRVVYIEGNPYRIMPQGSLTMEHFLEDLDYLVYVLENNFALLEVAYWAHGIDYQELRAGARALILQMEEPCEDMFLAIVFHQFFPLFGTGHFRIYEPATFRGTRAYDHRYRGLRGRMNFRRMTSPLAMRFYEDREEDSTAFELALEHVIENEGSVSNRFWDGANPEFVDLEFDVMIMDIIEKGKIAYLYARTMHFSPHEEEILDFYREIAEFEHLIIDLRSNPGGFIECFIDLMIRANLVENVEIPPAFAFFMDAPYVRRFDRYLFLPSLTSGYMTITEDYRQTAWILLEYDLPDAHLSDFVRFDYGAPYNRRDAYFTPNTADFDNQPAFGGKIWLLTDSAMGSAAQLAAWYAKETGVATLVGDTTGGNFGGPRTLALMPNTGIIFGFDVFYVTDASGRPLEAGTIPHHFNYPGMDALETVLMLIGEERY